MSACPHGAWHIAGVVPEPSAVATLRLGGRWLGPLVCASCGVPWPGAQLPDPYISLNDGYGDVARLQPWRTRVKGMVFDLEQLEAPA
jgi:hypothetical protein